MDHVQGVWEEDFSTNPAYSGSKFLELTTFDEKPIGPSTAQGGEWIKAANESNALFARMCRCILNHAPIGGYYLRFKIAEPYECKCGKVPVETRNHILHRCKRYKHPTKAIKSTWDLVQFLKANPLAFGFDRSKDGVG